MNPKAKQNVEVILKLFKAIERRDEERVLNLCQPDVEFRWPPSLPYGGMSRGFIIDRPGWEETWALLQPTDAERKLDPRVVAADNDEVVVVWHQRGVSPAGDRLDTEVVGLYQFRDEKLACAEMFYFDTVAVADFLAKAITPEQQRWLGSVFHRVKSLPAERRAVLRRVYGELQALPPNRWQQLLNSDKFQGMLSADERDLLNQMLLLDPSYRTQTAENSMAAPKP